MPGIKDSFLSFYVEQLKDPINYQGKIWSPKLVTIIAQNYSTNKATSLPKEATKKWIANDWVHKVCPGFYEAEIPKEI